MKRLFFLISMGLLLLNTACKPKGNINYMENIEQTAIQVSQNSKNTIQPGDQLIILVSAKDMTVVKPFNQNYSSSEISQFSQASSNLPNQSQTMVSGPTYIVDSNNIIDFPVVGDISTKDLSVEELKAKLKEKISQYVKNPSVNIRMTNFKVNVLGEVNKPGFYTIPDGQSATVLSAVGLAGDLTIYGVREKVLIVRNVDGQLTKAYLDLSDANLFNSPYFHLKQNDVITVYANKAKQNSSWFGPQTGVWISVASIVVTILALVVK